MSKIRYTLPFVAAFVVIGAVVVAAVSAGGAARGPGGVRAIAATTAPMDGGSVAKCNLLARQTSNRCGLQPAVLLGMSSDSRLQGSCCYPMNLAAYQSQVRGLRRYASISQIPRDPYDIPVSLAKRLLRYDRSVTLTGAQSRTLRRAVQMSREHRLCCCGCWRWYVTRGLSKYLIADRGWRAPRVAPVIGLFDGCGGPSST
jgi:hypothetical protein